MTSVDFVSAGSSAESLSMTSLIFTWSAGRAQATSWSGLLPPLSRAWGTTCRTVAKAVAAVVFRSV